MTKKEVCELLKISPKTLERRMAKGVYTFTRNGSGQYSELSFTHADLGLPTPEPQPAAPVPEPTPVPTPVIETWSAPEPEPKSAPCGLSEIELKAQADERFAQDFKAGLATDSLGNKISGTNDSRPTLGAVSLVGNIDQTQRPAIDTQAHMDPALIGASDASNAPRWSFDKGLSDEDLAAMRSDWRRRHGNAPSMSEQREAMDRSKQAINAAFDYAKGRYSR